MMNNLYGWYDSASQQEPTYDPPHDSPCPYCGVAVHIGDVRTHSFMAAEAPKRSYFYRTHITCDEAATAGMKQSVFDGVVDRVTADLGTP